MAKAWHASAAFKRRLAKLPEQVRQKTNEAIQKNAEEWVDWAQQAAPTDPKDGIHLRPSIRNYETETGGQVVRAGGEETTRQTEHGPYDYAMAQEFGTHAMPANPFFWTTYRFLRKRFASRRSRAMRQAIKDFNNGK